jgi:hypothetical protein
MLMDKFDGPQDGKSLSRRARRSGVALALARASEPGQMALRLRRSARDMEDLASDPNLSAADRIAATKALVSVQAQMLELIGWTKRPASAAGGKRPTAPILDVSPAGPPPDLG